MHTKKPAPLLRLGKIFYAERNVFGYRTLGIGRLIYQLPVSICEMFIEEIFGDESLDSIDGETLAIIRTFFENNLNLSETSRQLYVHRNTLVYRFEKIQKKFGLDLRTFEDAMTFKLAMLVSRLSEISEQNLAGRSHSLFQEHQMFRWQDIDMSGDSYHARP